MIKKVITKRLWNFVIVYEAELLSIISRGKYRWTEYEELTGPTHLEFEFYDLVWWWD